MIKNLINKKNVSILCVVVLVCACVVGALMIGTQAAGTDYVWYVGGSGDYHYADINAAMTAAAAKTDWAAGDTLTVNITASGTTAADATTRALFKVNTIFRVDNTMLPITIDGGANRYGFDLNGSGSSGLSCTNNYTFRNMDLTSWGQRGITFRAGSANVTFNNVDFGTGRNMKFAGDCQSKALFTGWTQARYNANKEADGYLYTSIAFIGVNYTSSNTDQFCARTNAGGYTVDYNDCAFGVNNVRSRIILGSGTTVTNVCGVGVSGVTDATKNDAYVVNIDGASVGTLYGVRASYTTYGNIITNVTAGSDITSFYPGPNSGTLNGNITNNILGVSTISTYRGGGMGGTVNGDVTNNFGDADHAAVIASATYGGNNDGGAINGTITNNLVNVTVSSAFYGGMRTGASASVKKIVNHFYDNVTFTGDGTHYGGSNNGKVVDYIENYFHGGDFTGAGYFYAGSNSATFDTPDEAITYRIKNTFMGTVNFKRFFGSCNSGALASDEYGILNQVSTYASVGATTGFYFASNSQTVQNVRNVIAGTLSGSWHCGGSNTGSVTNLVNEIQTGANIAMYYATNNSSGTVGTVTNRLEGGYVGVFYGGGNHCTTTTVQNYLGKDDGGVLSGTCRVGTFYGGAKDAAAVVNTISNTYYSGVIGQEARAENGSVGTGVVSYGGSLKGTVGVIQNTFNGGTFNCGYFYGGNASTASFDGELHDFAVGECQITNTVNAADFVRFCGGSAGGAVSTIKNVLNGAEEGAIRAYSNAIYCGHGASGSTSVENVVTGYVTSFFGGSNGDDISSVTNTISAGANVGTFHGGSNTKGTVGSITNNYNAGTVTTSYGGMTKAAGTTTQAYATMATAITNNFAGTTIETAYGGSQSGGMGSITNNVTAGTVKNFYGGALKPTVTQVDEGVASEVFSTVTSISNNVPVGSTVHITYFYGGNNEGNVTTVTNQFRSSDSIIEVLYGSNHGSEDYRKSAQGAGGTVTNTFAAGTFYTVYGGARRGTVTKITNNVSGGTYQEDFYAGNNQGVINWTDASDRCIYTTVTGGIFQGRFYGGSCYGDITGNGVVKTVIQDGSFQGDVFNGSRSGNITQGEGNTGYCLEMTINGGNFVRYIGASDGEDGFQSGTRIGGSITGDIINRINGGTFTGGSALNAAMANYSLILGGNRGLITGSVTNNINATGGTINVQRIAVGGGFQNVISMSGTRGFAVQNTITDPSDDAYSLTFHGFWGGSVGYGNAIGSPTFRIEGKIVNTVSGGTFEKHYGAGATGNAFAGSCSNGAHQGNVVNTIRGGTFNSLVSGGQYILDSTFYTYAYWAGSVRTDIYNTNSPVFNATVHACAPSGYYYDADKAGQARFINADLYLHGNTGITTSTSNSGNSSHPTNGTVHS